MASEADVPVGGFAVVFSRALVPGTAWAIASGMVAGSGPSEVEITGLGGSVARVSEKRSGL